MVAVGQQEENETNMDPWGESGVHIDQPFHGNHINKISIQ
jgi:hypothetical protein